jgi:hypothetical protein
VLVIDHADDQDEDHDFLHLGEEAAGMHVLDKRVLYGGTNTDDMYPCLPSMHTSRACLR